MLFKNIKDIKTQNEKKFFLEKIKLIYRIIEEYCSFNNIEYIEYIENEEKAIKELIDIGIIENREDLSIMKKLIKSEYNSIIKALSFYSENKKKSNYILKKFYNSYRRKVQLESENNNYPTIVDLFAGAGGLSLGFVQNNYKIELANEIQEICTETYRFNHPEVKSEKVVNDDIIKIVEHIDSYLENKDIDIVIGGPPCQSFSSANRQRVIDDPRNILYKYFIKAVGKIKPKFIVMENVKGMLSVAEQVVEDFANVRVEVDGEILNYDVRYNLFNSSDFSVAQSRERLIYIGVRSDIQRHFNISAQDIIDEINNSNKHNTKYVLADALRNIKSLESPTIKNMTEVDCESTGKKVDKNIYVERNNEYLELINNGEWECVITNHKARFANETNLEIFKILEQGEDSTSEKIAHIMPYKHRNHLFKDKYYRLIEDKPCRTITAHLQMDCLSHIHPTQARTITPREAARIQSFPDDYVFLGAYLKTYMQIGNAVPPVMARKIALILKKYL
ncbi:MAG: DNA cytosine methyltransferase [Clostridium sp.]|uniref:DNA cytosine methyltransferase n=1 Tax=Clostridium sp. TaxID=1506 RepID=UPI002A7519C3|nr:DNA cytosine methyltransferase [Clostridium sp.]MDY2631702.1 DNA cytosine methyltransferase [Clostridium sp.]MDY6228538.1 DNA cytosine methyltransferase [Clostridium sp.]